MKVNIPLLFLSIIAGRVESDLNIQILDPTFSPRDLNWIGMY